jgi:hypothetical protein
VNPDDFLGLGVTVNGEPPPKTSGNAVPVSTEAAAAVEALIAERLRPVIEAETDRVMQEKLADVEKAVRTAERERIRELAIAHRAVTISPSGKMLPFEEMLRRSPEDNMAALLEVVRRAEPEGK